MGENKGRIVGFWEESQIVDLIDKVAQARGVARSSFIRETIRQRLAELSFLSEDVKKSLGVKEENVVG